MKILENIILLSGACVLILGCAATSIAIIKLIS